MGNYREHLGLLHSFRIFARVGVDADDVTRVDEEGHIHLRAGGELHELGAARDGVTLHGRRSILNLEVDLDRNLDSHWLLVVGEDLDLGIRGEPLHPVMHHLVGEGETMLGVARLGEPALAARSVEVIRSHHAHIGLGNRLILMEGDFDDPTRDEVTQLGLIDRLPLLHAEDMRRENLVGFAIVIDNGLRENLIVC